MRKTEDEPLPAETAPGGEERDRSAGPTAATEGSDRLAPGQFSEVLRQLARGDGAEASWGTELLPGAVIDRYELVRQIGRGGFGVVWEAIDRRLGRRVAFKAVRAGASGAALERLEIEGETAARLSHSNIVTVFDAGQVERKPYLVLELLRGRTLAERLEEKKALPVEEALRIATEIARGVAHAHAHGVVHRDLKPANVFLCDDGRVKVLDLGLAHALGHVNPTGGTRGYMAPEQAKGAPEDERTDVFALGVVLFRMLSGKQPFVDEAALLNRWPAPALDVPGAPYLGELVARLLEKDPLKRPRDAGEVAGEFEALAAPVAAARQLPARVRRWQRHERSAWAASLAFIVLVGGWLYWKGTQPREHPERRLQSSAGPVEDVQAARTVIAVADLDNQTGDRRLDGLAGMLVTSLEQSRVLAVVFRGHLLDVLDGKAKEEGFRLDEDRTREAAQRARAALVVASTLHRLGELYVLEVRARATSGQLRFSLREQERGIERLPDLVDRVSEQLRLRMGEDQASVAENSIAFGRTVTASPIAWDHYARARACVERAGFSLGYGPCLEELRQAVKADPEFALAHLLLSEVSYSEGLPLSAQREALAPALGLEARIPPSQRLRIHGWAAFLDGRTLEAKGLLRRAAEFARDDKFAWRRAGEVPFHRDEFAEALPFFEQVHRLDPSWIEATEHLVTALGCTGDLNGIGRVARGLETLGRQPAALAGLCMARLWIGPERAVAACEEAVAAGAGSMGEQYLAIALLNRGERGRLARHLERMSLGAPVVSFPRFMQMLLASQEGRWTRVLADVEAGSASEDPWAHATYAEVSAGLGDATRVGVAADRTAELDPKIASHAAVHLAYLGALDRAAGFERYLPEASTRLATYRAVVRWRRGDLPGAIEDLRGIAAGAPVSADPAVPHPLFLLGEALVAAGRHGDAAPALERFLGIPLTYPSWTRPRALYLLAVAREHLGRRAAAREAARELMELWRHADARQPGLAEAAGLARRLGVP